MKIGFTCPTTPEQHSNRPAEDIDEIGSPGKLPIVAPKKTTLKKMVASRIFGEIFWCYFGILHTNGAGCDALGVREPPFVPNSWLRKILEEEMAEDRFELFAYVQIILHFFLVTFRSKTLKGK